MEIIMKLGDLWFAPFFIGLIVYLWVTDFEIPKPKKKE